MARFTIFHYLFAVVVALVLVANARPTSSEPNTGDVAGMPGMASELNGGAKANSNNQDANSMAANEEDYMNDMKKAMEAAAKAAAKATPTTAGARPTPGVPTTAPSKPSQSSAQANPSSTPTAAAKPKGLLSGLPLIGGLAGGLPF